MHNRNPYGRKHNANAGSATMHKLELAWILGDSFDSMWQLLEALLA